MLRKNDSLALYLFTFAQKELKDSVTEKKRHIITWIMLICFTAGQFMIYAHQHIANLNTKLVKTQNHTLKEKCQLCDAMHHSFMDVAQQTNPIPLTGTEHVYTKFDYEFVSISLILSAGRSPPIS